MSTTPNSLAGMIREGAANHPDRVAFTFGERTLTYGELDRRASRVANSLLASGVQPQENVAFLDKNSLEYFEVLFGCAKINAVTIAINWRLAPPEMAWIINDAQARVLFVHPDFASHLEKFEPELTTVRKVVVLGVSEGHQAYDDWLSDSETDPMYPSAGGDVAMQLYTSGTTGHPKGAMLTNENLLTMFPRVARAWLFDDQSVHMVAMPLFHIAGSGMSLVGLSAGASTVLLRDVNPAEILELIPKYRVTNALFVPAVMQFMLQQPQCAGTDFSSLRMIVYGASPIPKDVLVQAIETFKCKFMQAYGLTETTGTGTLLPPEAHTLEDDTRLRSCGLPAEGTELRIVDPATNTDMPQGEVGEVWLRSQQVMKGYWRKPEATAESITADGWFKTGDAGYVDGEGYLYLHDRVKDMIVSGGENIYPAEIESALFSHPEIADVAVIGVPDDRWGEAVKAVVVRTQGSSLSEEDVVAFARERIAAFKRPQTVDFVDVLPRNPSGKILKRELREPYWAGRERRVN